MNVRTASRSLLACTPFLLAACSGSDDLAGRPNSSETENALAARILLPDGRPASGARVILVDERTWATRLAAGAEIDDRSYVADDSGRVDLRVPSDGAWRIQIQSPEDGLFDTLRVDQAHPVWRLSPLQPFEGNIRGVPTATTRICLSGTTFCSGVDAQGRFRFAALPSGKYMPALHDTIARSVAPLSGATISPTAAGTTDSILVVPDTLVLEDFEDGNAKGSLSSWTGTSGWWVYSSLATSLPAGTSAFPSRIVADAETASKVLHLTTSGMDSATGSLVLLGLDLGAGSSSADSSRVFADLSGLRTLRLRVKGTGSLKIFFQTERTLRLGDEIHLGTTIPLTGSWQEIAIDPAQIVAAPNSLAAAQGLRFADVATRTSAIVLQFRYDGDYFVDDLRLEGIRAVSLRGWNE